MMKFWSDTFDPIEKKVLKSDLINNEDFASLVCDLDIVPIKVFIPCRHVPKGGGGPGGPHAPLDFGRSEGAAGSPLYFMPPQIFRLWHIPVGGGECW